MARPLPLTGGPVSQPEPDRAAIETFVTAFREETGHRGEVDQFAFADTPEVQTRLARLVLEEGKRATAGLYADPDDPVPAVGQHDVVMDGAGAPVCLIRTDEVRTLPFGERDPAFAWDEGEGNRTLQDWTDGHLRYFRRRAEGLGIAFDDASLVNFERFTVVWPELDAPAPVVEEGRLAVRPVRPDDRAWVRTVTGGVTADDGWPTDRCPGLLARHAGRTAGVLVFVPSTYRTEVVALSLLEDAEGVEQVLRDALARLRGRYGWGAVDG